MPLLKLTVLDYSATELKITVKNDSGVLLDKSLMIELFPPTYLVDPRIEKAADEFMTDPLKSGLGGIVTGPPGWSFWAKPASTVETLTIEIDNDVDQATNQVKTPIETAAGASFVITIPLKAQAARQDIKLAFKYNYNNSSQSFEGELDLKSDAGDWQPEVTLEAVDCNPLAITPGTSVTIKWTIKAGVSATLYGPLPEGNTFLTLSSDPAAVYKISEGKIPVVAAARMSYLLRAMVKGPAGQMVQVARTLTLDTLTSDKYLYVSTRPNKVLPYGRVFIDWAAWGFTPVQIDVGSRETHRINLPGRIPGGSGYVTVNASGNISDERVNITAQSLKKSAEITMISWLPVTSNGVGGGQPIGMAVVAPKLAVLTTEGLFIADVGMKDSGSTTNLTFTKSTTTAPKQWLALAAVDRRFVALRRTSQDDLEVAPYKLDGSADQIPPVTLPADLRLLVAARETVFDFVGFRGRAYVVVETVLSTGILRRAFSVGFGASSAEYRTEPLLEALVGYKLVVFNNALFALNRKTGRMLRFNLSISGTLETPLQAASAVTKSSGAEQSMIKDGLIVPVGEVLAVLGPNAIPSLEEIEKYEPRKVIIPTKKMLQAVDPYGNPQDIFYNPQKDYWGRCGHGIDVKPGAIAAFRSGDSQRLWLIQPDGKMHTLSVGLESLFAHDFLPGALPWPLVPYFKKRQLMIENWCGVPLQPMSSLLSGPIAHSARAKFDLYYNDADSPVQLRFLLERAKGVKDDFWLEVTFYGPDLSRTRDVFQRVQTDGQGTISLAEIPNSTSEHPTDVGLYPAMPTRLIEGVRLQIFNFTSYQFWQQAPEASDPGAKRYDGEILRINYNTPNFFVFAHGAGELHVNVDYSLPTGIEISPGSQRQSKLIRINTDRSKGLYPELVPPTEGAPFQVKITYRHKKVVDGVYVGDGVGAQNGAALFFPVAHTRDQSQVQIWKVNPEDLSHVATGNLSSSLGLFAPSNSLALAGEYVYAMIENDIHVFDYSLQKRGQANLNYFFTFVNDIDGFTDSTDCYLLGMKQDRPIDTSRPIWSHFLHGVGVMNRDATGKVSLLTVRDTSLDSVKAVPNPVRGAPTWVSSATLSPMAASPARSATARRVAVCMQGGIFVSDPAIRPVPVAAAGREEDIIFGGSGKVIYCLHTRADNQGLLLSRIMVDTWQVQSLSLPRGEGPYDLASGSQQAFPPFPNKNQRAVSVARTPEENLLFVSHGKSIFKIDNGPTMAVRDTLNMELPCRIFHVAKAKPTSDAAPCNVVYALGASYRGDGKSGSGVTHLYKLGVLDK